MSDLRVTSPTYLLSNTYPVEDGDLLIHHMDLYRLSEGKEDDLSPLNLDFVMKECISLIEWPSRLGTLEPGEKLEITIKIDKDGIGASDDDSEESPRILYLTPHGLKWEERLKQIQNDGYLDDLIIEYEPDYDEENDSQ